MSAKPASKAPAAGAAVILALAATLVMHLEGVSLTGYADPIGIPTICFGHTGPEVEVGDIATPNECRRLLDKDMAEHHRGLRRCLTRPIAAHEEAALVSWTYNVGVGAACKSTLVRKANAGQPFCAELDKWVYAGGIKFRGLVKRRAAERKLCEGS